MDDLLDEKPIKELNETQKKSKITFFIFHNKKAPNPADNTCGVRFF